jgi:hypothetical protein
MCVIVCKKVNGKYIFFKNRDRPYQAPLKLVRELKNGVEMAYINDLKTGWIEGMNEYGIGVINSTFKYKTRLLKLENLFEDKIYDSVKGQKIYAALSCKTLDEVVHYLFKQKYNQTFFLNGKNVDGNKYPIEGHTFIFSKEGAYHVECTKNNTYVINKTGDNEAYTNHGVEFPEEGNIQGIKGLSSVLRKYICEHELKTNKIDDPESLFTTMNKNYYNLNPLFHLYRDRFFNAYFFNNFQTIFTMFHPALTCSQMLLNPSENEIIINIDNNNSELVEIENRLPSDHVSKISIRINETAKSQDKVKLLLDEQILQSAYEKFSYKEIGLEYIEKNKILIVIILLLILWMVGHFLFFNKKIPNRGKSKKFWMNLFRKN